MRHALRASALVVAMVAVARDPGAYSNDALCRSQEFRAAFLEGQQGIIVDETEPSTKLVGHGRSGLACLEAIAERGGAAFAIEGCLENTHDCRSWALAAIRMMGTPEARAYLLKYLDTVPDKDLRIGAIAALGSLRERSARSRLLALVKSVDPDVRAESIVALGAIGRRGDFGAMHEAAVLLPDGEFYRAVHGFRLLGDPRAVEALEERVRAISDPTIRFAVDRTFESWRLSVTEEARILSALRSERDEELYAAIRASRSTSEEMREALYRVLKRDDPRARAEAIVALGRMHVSGDFRRLLQATLRLPEPYVPLASTGLELLNDARAIEPLEHYAAGMKDVARRSQVQGVVERLKRSGARPGAGASGPGS